MSLPKVYNIKRFDTDSNSVPQSLRLILRAQIRDVFSRRQVFSSAVLSNAGIDAYLDAWWSHHQNIIRAASIRPEWDWTTLSLHYNQNVSRPVNFLYAMRDFLVLTAFPPTSGSFSPWDYDSSNLPPSVSRPSSERYFGEAHPLLYRLYFRAFTDLVLEGNIPSDESVYTDEDAYVSADTVSMCKEKITSLLVKEGQKGSDFSIGLSAIICPPEEGKEPDFVPFNRLPSKIFDAIHRLRTNSSGTDDLSVFFFRVLGFLSDNSESFLVELYRACGCHQMAGSRGPVKTTVTNKLIRSFYDWLAALSFTFPANPFRPIYSFADAVDHLKVHFYYGTTMAIKVRNRNEEGYRLAYEGSFEQIFARLQEWVKGSFTNEHFIVSFHPCDMITCSLGYKWSSCQSWIDMFNDLPAGYGVGSHYSGQFNRGNFEFSCGNGFIAYIPHEELPGVPQYLWAKKKRCLLWVGDNLDCMRQNFFYPGKPTDLETLAFGKVVREYIQDVCAPFNFTNGTVDWKVKSLANPSRNYCWANSVVDAEFDKFDERFDPNGFRYDDPIMALSYLKKVDEKPILYYALDFPSFDLGMKGTSFFNHGGSDLICPVCGKKTARGGVCSTCSKEMVEHNGVKVHPSDLVCLTIDGRKRYFDIEELDKVDDYVVSEDGTAVEFKSAYKVFMPSGIKYFKDLPNYVRQCKVCKEYFHPSFMVGDVCIEHFNQALQSDDDGFVVNVPEVIKSFMAKTLSFDCNDTDNLIVLLRMLDEKNIKWVSGQGASQFVPRTNMSKHMFLSLDPKGRLILSAQAKSTVIMLSNLFKKGVVSDEQGA